ncbi:hypothetical protein KEJ28_01140 [Candidatus Bathyarchaeota archaeon]|nr:hypothetical protein [Candidatus Bathyarchaeota archaeon]
MVWFIGSLISPLATNALGLYGIKFLTNLIFGIAWFLIELFMLTIVLYVAGRTVVGERKARLSDALIIALLGTILSAILIAFIPYGLIALILSTFVWLLLIKRLYETGWLGAIAVGILALLIFIAILLLLALIIGTLHIIINWLLPKTISGGII